MLSIIGAIVALLMTPFVGGVAPPIHASFPLQGVYADGSPAAAPVILSDEDQTVITISFISPVSGLCATSLYNDATGASIGATPYPVAKGDAIQRLVTVPGPDDMADLGMPTDKIIIYVACASDSKTEVDSTMYVTSISKAS